MKKQIAFSVWASVGLMVSACSGGAGGGPGGRSAEPMPRPRAEETEEKMRHEAVAFLEGYQVQLAALSQESALAYWRAATSGDKADFEAYAAAELALKQFHSDAETYQRVRGFLAEGAALPPLTRRALQVALLDFEGNQLPEPLIEEMVAAQAKIERSFNTFRAEVDGEARSNNELLDALKEAVESREREKLWKGLKQVGQEVAGGLVALAKVRNRAARSLGYADFFEMEIRLQEHDQAVLISLFDELEALTEAPYAAMKRVLDAELAQRLGITPAEIRPWHYDNPFFQAAPPSEAVDPDVFYEHRKEEAIMPMAARFFRDIGLPVDQVIDASDLYGRDGKDQHAFCISFDRKQDVRTLLNIRPTAGWMDTALHEEGHAAYYVNIDPSLPFNLREAAHIFTTEAVAMLFGALAYNPAWLVAYAGVGAEEVAQYRTALLEQRRREQLIFARWAMVMFHFEQALYANPGQDLNTLWWDLVERFQKVPRPEGRDAPDWAAKPHFTIAPVYYHNYLLGEVFAAQLRHVMAEMVGHRGPASELSFEGRTVLGDFLRAKVFRPGKVEPWPRFVAEATGEPLTARYFAGEVTLPRN